MIWFVTEDFNLPMGLFLMLGFSKKEEALLKSATGSGVAEAIPPLQQLFRSIAINLGVSILYRELSWKSLMKISLISLQLKS